MLSFYSVVVPKTATCARQDGVAINIIININIIFNNHPKDAVRRSHVSFIGPRWPMSYRSKS